MNEQNELKLEGTANARQVGGNHYKKDLIEHWDTVVLFNLDYFQGNIWKYVLRWRHKNGLQDLDKAGHYLQKYKEVEAARANGTLTRSILERAILELEEIEQQEEQAAAYRAQAKGDDPVADVLSGYKFKLMPVCNDYRPMVALGPCSHCDHAREEHTLEARKIVGHHHDRCTHGADDCPIHPNGGCPAAPVASAAPGGLPAGVPGAQG